jgi:hypothetical protein
MTTRLHRVAAVTAVGTSHLDRGVGCQDAVAVRTWGPVTVAALADGAGSAPAAERGAGIAVFSALYHLQRALGKRRIGKPLEPDVVLRRVLREVRIDLKRTAKKHRLALDDLAATLIVAVSNSDTGDLHTLHIGDGAIVAGPPWRIVSAPQQGPSREYTHFVTDRDAERRAVVTRHRCAGPLTLVLFSDGLQDLIIQGETISKPFFDWCHAVTAAPDPEADIAALMASDDVRSRTSDDLSLALLRAVP